MGVGTVREERLEALRGDIRDVRAQIVEVVMHMDDIVLQQLPQIRIDYAIKIGCWEQALLEAELAARRARRKLSLAQAQANHGEKPEMEAIDAILDEELVEWMEKVEQAQLSYELALTYLTSMKPMTRMEETEFKKLYRTLVKRLHPDVCPSDDDHRAILFQLAQAAYRNGDIEALRSLEVATRHLDPRTDDLDDVSDQAILEQELELAQIELEVMRGRLHELEESEEMRLGKLLADPAWVTKRTTELRHAVEEWERMQRAYDTKLRELMGDFDD